VIYSRFSYGHNVTSGIFSKLDSACATLGGFVLQILLFLPVALASTVSGGCSVRKDVLAGADFPRVDLPAGKLAA